jgi:hypothetical protein
MMHRTLSRFWDKYKALPLHLQALADKNYHLLERDPYYPSLHFKQVGELWSVRVGENYRAIAFREDDIFYWFWIGPHDEYERLIRSSSD